MTECSTSGTVFYVNFVKRKTAFVGGFAGCGNILGPLHLSQNKKHLGNFSSNLGKGNLVSLLCPAQSRNAK